jgi:CRP-like cAMP-binding protein
MALIDGSVRSATVRAKTDCDVAPINEKTFFFLVHETPFFAIAVMRALAGRLRHMNEPYRSSRSRTRHFWPFNCCAPRP